MRKTRQTRRRNSALRRAACGLVALCLAVGAAPALASGDIAYDLNGSLEATDPSIAESIPYEEESEPEYSMTSADVIIGYVAPAGSSLHPAICTEQSLVSINQLAFECLVDLDDQMRPVPMLADSWERDGKTWTFKLRSGVQFHNGVSLTAYDVVRSYEALLGSTVSNPYLARLQLIKGMEATSSDTLVVTGRYSGLSTLYAMNFPVMQSATLGDEIPRGTGPYWIIVRDALDTFRLEANPLWWKRQPKIKSILLKRYNDAGDALQAIQTGQIHMLSTSSPKAAFSRKLADLTSMDYTTLTYEMLIPNLGRGLMSNVSVRQAVMYAIDRSVIASNGYGDMAVQCEVPIPPTSWLYESQSAIYYYSPERALQLMHNLGWYDMTGNGKLNQLNGIILREPNLTLITYNESTNSIRENTANLIASYLEAIGFNVTVSVVGKARLRELIRSRSFDLALVGVNLSEIPSVSALFSRDGDLNLNGFGNDNMEMLLERAVGTTRESELKKIYSDIQMYLVNRLPVLGLVFRTGTVLSTRSLGGMSGIRFYDAFNGFEFLEP